MRNFADFRPINHSCTGNQIGHTGRFFIKSLWISSFMKNFKKRSSSHFAIGCVLSICVFFFKSVFHILALPLQFGSKTGSPRGQGEGKGEGSSVALASPIFMFPISFLPLRFLGRISLVHSFFFFFCISFHFSHGWHPFFPLVCPKLISIPHILLPLNWNLKHSRDQMSISYKPLVWM